MEKRECLFSLWEAAEKELINRFKRIQKSLKLKKNQLFKVKVDFEAEWNILYQELDYLNKFELKQKEGKAKPNGQRSQEITMMITIISSLFKYNRILKNNIFLFCIIHVLLVSLINDRLTINRIYLF